MSNLTHRLAALFAPVCRSLGVGVFAAVLFTGLAAQAALPAGYTQLDYIEGTGSAWINSGINPTADLVVQMTIEQTTSNMGRGECALFGNQWSGNGYVPIFSGGTVVFYSNGGNVSFQTALVLDTQYHFTFDATGMTVVVGEAASGTRCNLPSSTFNNVDANLYIFGGFPGRTCSSHRLYSMTMTVGDVCVREFVPAKDADGNVGLYDIADHSDNPDYEPFYKSKTNSNFIAGPDYIDYSTFFIVSAAPEEIEPLDATIRYGVTNVVEGDELTVPASFARINGTYSCTGYKLYEYTNGDYVEIPGRAGEGNSFTVTAADIGTGRKLVWQWAYALPEDYQQIEYISSTGSQYINAGLVPNTKTTLEMDFNSGTYTETTVLFGQSWSGSRYLFNEQSNKFMFHGNGTDIRAFVANTDMHVSITADDKFILTVGDVVTTNNISRATSAETMGIFGTGSGGNKSKFTLYSMQISQDGVVVRDFVPCRRKSDGVVGLFDCAYHSDNQSYDPFYVNRGSSEFVAGPDVIDPTAFYISAYPQEFNTDPATILYGAIDVGADRVLSVPTEIPFNNGNYVCTGYKLYEYTNGDYVEIPGRAGAGNSFTVTAGDVGTGRKLVWQWTQEYKYTSADYVKTGLVAFWDGLENAVDGEGKAYHNDEATVWSDLVGGLAFTLYGSVTVGETYFGFNGNSANYGQIASGTEGLETAFFSGEKTVEVTVNAKVANQSAIVLMGTSTAKMLLGPAGGATRAALNTANGPYYTFGLPANSISTFATIYGANNSPAKFNFNGASVVPSTGTADWDGGDANAWIGRRSSGNAFNGNIYSIRIYNRSLEADEIAYNCALDRIRLGGEDADEVIDEVGIRKGADGRFEYLLSLGAGEDGEIQVTTNGVSLAAVSSIKLWLPEGTLVEVNYLPNTPNDWRYLSGAPANAVYPTPTKVTFAMAAGRFVMEAVEYPYSDENIVSVAPFTKTTPYVGRVVYTFTDATVGRASFFFKKTLTYEESLVVAGGGGGSSWNAGGGGGGVIRNTDAKVFAVGESMIVTVGAGGVGGHVNQHDDRRGENSVLQFGTTALTALGGGAGVCGTSYDQCDGGSGGGANVNHCGVGTVGQGFNGGSHNNAGGGGGGAEGPGGSAVTSGDSQHGGNGGVGRWDSITGEAHCYGSGGGAQYNSNGFDVPGEGGADSGGRGGYASSAHGSINGENGVDGLGGGGGAMGAASGVGGKGGSGTVIVAFSTTDTTDKRFAFEPFDSYPIVNGAATPKPVVTVGGTTLVENEDYELHYENNTQNGALAYMVVVGKAGTACEGQVVRQMFRPAGIHYVKSVATGSGDGSDWANAMTLEEAVNGLANGTYDIWCAAGTYDLSGIPAGLKIPCETAIRGGFAADATDILKKAADGAKTIFDGANVSTLFFDSNFSVGAASFAIRQVVFEDCVFQRSTKMCVRSSSKATPFTFIRCEFLNNAVTGSDNYGTCYHGNQCGYAPVKFKECRFEGNIFTNGSGGKAQIYADTVALTVDGCAFVTNGVPYTQTGMGDRNGGLDQCIWCLGTTTATITNCDFRGNAPWTNYGDHMGIIRFEYSVNGTIVNCRFVGNSIYAPAYGKTGMGILTLLPNNNYRQTVRNCTFAFNTVDKDADGCSVIRGDGQDNGIVEIENCIFWQNAGSDNNKNKRDLQVNAANTTVRYSLFEDLAQGGCVNVALDGTNMTGDPKFVSTNKIVDLMKPGLASGRVWLDPARINEILALDVHLLSPEAYSKNDGSRVEKEEEAPLSPMIDSGDPEADYSNEPGRNGGRLNVGGYGNTLEASETPYADPVLATPTVDYATEYTQPTINLTMGGDGQFNVTVTIWASADGETWIESEGFVMGNGSTAGWLVPSYFPVGGKIYLKTAYSFQGTPTETSYEAIDVDPTKVLPPWDGKGGDPDKVVHVREGATGKCDGTSWTDAFVNMGQAMRALSATKNEMWIAGTVETIAGDRGTTFSFTYPIIIRGGFTGAENAPEQRADKQATAMITGLGVYDGLKLSGSGAKVFENVIFDGGLVRGLYLESGSAAFTNCVFQGNGTDLVKKQFDGRVFFSKNLRPLILSGCTFRNNLVKGPWLSNGNYGHQIRLESSDVYMDGCLFVSNGVPKSVEAVTSTDYEGSSDATPGFMLAFYGSDRVFCVRDTKFVGNTLPCATYNGGSALQIGGFRNRVAFTNCLFKANEVVQLNKLSRNSNGPEQDLLFIQNAGNFDSGNITTEVVNCTFAYNQTVRNVAMGLTVSCSGTTKVKNCIFAGNRMSGGLSRNQLRLDNTATIDHTCFDSTNGMSQATIDKILAGEGNLLCEPGFYSTTNDLANARVSDAAGSHFDWEHPEKYLNFNVHLVGRAGYIDETTGEKVVGEGKPSPCVDAGDPASPYRRETKPRGHRVNMGFYGNTPYQTQSTDGMAVRIR